MLISSLEMARLLEEDEKLSNIELVQSLYKMYPETKARYKIFGDGVAIITGETFPINRVIGFGMQQKVSNDQIEEIEQWFKAYSLVCEIELCPLADPTLHKYMLSHTYNVVTFKNTNVRSLANFTDLPISQGLEIVETTDADLWAVTLVDDGSSKTLNESLLRLSKSTVQRPNTRCFLAYVGDKPVGGAMLGVHGKLAVLSAAVTHVDYRRRGVQTSLIQARLKLASGAGCTLARAIAVPGGVSQANLERAGFQIAYTKPTLQNSLFGELLA